MLNELKSLSESMANAGILMQSWHRLLVGLPKGAPLKLYIDENGKISGVQLLSAEDKDNYRKFEIKLGDSFPVFNIEIGIPKEPKELGERLKKLYNNSEKNYEEIISLLDEHASFRKSAKGTDTEQTIIEKNLNRVPGELKAIIGDIPEEFSALREVIERAAKIKPGEFFRQLKELVFEKIRNDPKNAKQWANILTGKTSVILEPSGDFKYPANHEKVMRWINEKLYESSKDDWNLTATDAFGRDFDKEKSSGEVMPKVRLPKFGDVKLRSMFDAIPCQFRHDKAGSESFHIGLDTRKEMKAALEWLGDESRQGKTWANIAGVSGFGNGLLFAYPSELPETLPDTTDMFAPEDDDTDPDGVNFEAKAARVIPAVHGIVKDAPDAKMNIFALVKPDGYRTKVLFSERYELSRLPSAAEEWKDGCGNIPFLLAEPSTPFPSEVVKCLNCEWIRDGTEMADVHGLGIGEGIKLLMETENYAKPIIERALNIAVKNSTPLLLGYAHERQKGSKDYKLPGKGWVRKANKDKNFKAVHQVNLVPPILGLLLFKLNINKEDYMNNAPFLVGRFLAFVDLLHKEYCKNVRGDEKGQGGIPNQLIGNAMMRTALGSPQRAMSQLSDRLPVYQGWASTRGTGLAKWTLKKMGEITNALSTLEWPERMRDAEKAQLLLGYFAREPKEVDQDDENTNENKTN